MGAVKQAMIEKMSGRSEKDVKITEMKAYIAHLEMLIKHFGFCNPDLQIARLDKHEANKKFREHWSKAHDPKMPAFEPREELRVGELKPPGTV
jgi:hypothetical protein